MKTKKSNVQKKKNVYRAGTKKKKQKKKRNALQPCDTYIRSNTEKAKNYERKVRKGYIYLFIYLFIF